MNTLKKCDCCDSTIIDCENLTSENVERITKEIEQELNEHCEKFDACDFQTIIGDLSKIAAKELASVFYSRGFKIKIEDETVESSGGVSCKSDNHKMLILTLKTEE
jgi:hypothetical protein